MKRLTYYFKSQFQGAKHHQSEAVSMNDHLRIHSLIPMATSPSMSYCTETSN
jgi:hypothetical protein